MNNLSFLKEIDFQKHFGNTLQKHLQNDKVMIGLSGGTSLDSFFEDLKIVFSRLDSSQKEKIYFCFLDERMVKISSNECNYKNIYHKFFSTLLDNHIITQKQILVPNIFAPDIPGEYFRLVKHIDISLFGVGEDGHIASLFPHHPLLLSKRDGYGEIMNAPKNPPHRITILTEEIKKIHDNYVFFMGEKKKGVFERFQNEEVKYIDFPVNILKQTHNCFVVSDMVT